MNFNYIMLLASAGGILALGLAFFKTLWIFKQPVEDEKLKRIGGHVAEGAMAFLAKEYSVLLPFVIVVTVLLAVFNRGVLRLQALSFAAGALCSALAGFIGMKVATASNSRTTYAAKSGLNKAFKVAFSGGTVMGMSVVGLALLGISFTFVVVFKVVSGSAAGDSTSVEKTVLDSLARSVLSILAGFSLGASSIALFSRVGGGIFTKAADVVADLVGKVEADIPEDDPRNPATIADNVGDNVGDVAGPSRHYEGKLIFADLDINFRNPYFDIDRGLAGLVPHADGCPKATKFISTYRVLEHIDFKAIGNLYLTTPDAVTLKLTEAKHEVLHSRGNLRIFAEIDPLKMLLLTDYDFMEFGKFITTPNNPKGAPKIFYTQIDIDIDEFLKDIKQHPFVGMPIETLHPSKLRDAVYEMKDNPEKRTKGLSLYSSLNSIPYRCLRYGFMFADQNDSKFFPLPKQEEIEKINYKFWHSM